MLCAGWRCRVEEAARSVAGVTGVSEDPVRGRLTGADSDDQESLRRAVERAGYPNACLSRDGCDRPKTASTWGASVAACSGHSSQAHFRQIGPEADRTFRGFRIVAVLFCQAAMEMVQQIGGDQP